MENLYHILNLYTGRIGLAVYLEPSIGPSRRELESKIIALKNFLDDRLVLAGNLVIEVEREESALPQQLVRRRGGVQSPRRHRLSH